MFANWKTQSIAGVAALAFAGGASAQLPDLAEVLDLGGLLGGATGGDLLGGDLLGGGLLSGSGANTLAALDQAAFNLGTTLDALVVGDAIGTADGLNVLIGALLVDLSSGTPLADFGVTGQELTNQLFVAGAPFVAMIDEPAMQLAAPLAPLAQIYLGASTFANGLPFVSPEGVPILFNAGAAGFLQDFGLPVGFLGGLLGFGTSGSPFMGLPSLEFLGLTPEALGLALLLDSLSSADIPVVGVLLGGEGDLPVIGGLLGGTSGLPILGGLLGGEGGILLIGDLLGGTGGVSALPLGLLNNAILGGLLSGLSLTGLSGT